MSFFLRHSFVSLIEIINCYFMGISDLYLSIGQKRNISHFANIVRIAKADNNISSEEIEFLSRISNKYNITDEKFREILRDPESFPTIAHLECVERIERLYELLEMVKADHQVVHNEVSMLKRIVTGLAFPLHKVDLIVDKSLALDTENISVEEFTEAMLEMLKTK